MPHEPDTVRHYRLRIYGHILSERKPTCYTLFALAFFFGENGSEENTGCGFVHTSEYMERNGDPGDSHERKTRAV